MSDKVNDKHFYVFVNLNGDKMKEPNYFITTGKEARGKVKQYTTRGIIPIGTLNYEMFINRWDKIK